MMRQAGRYLPEYRALRAEHDFLDMVYTPALAAEVTVQPVRVLKVDAAILFSDILVVPHAMGMELTIEEGVGPRFHRPLRSAAEIAEITDPFSAGRLDPVLEAVAATGKLLAGEVPLIGFAGAPWTLACYMVEGGGSKHFAKAKRLLARDPDSAHALLARLADASGRFLEQQVRAGADVVQIFDSWAGALGPSDYRTFGLPYLARTVARAKDAGAPVIVFALGAGWALEEIAEATAADVIGIDWHTDAGEARRRLAKYPVAVQGNMDPTWLYASPKEIQRRTDEMLEAFGRDGYIANLGHGILPDTPVPGARAFVNTIRGFEP